MLRILGIVLGFFLIFVGYFNHDGEKFKPSKVKNVVVEENVVLTKEEKIAKQFSQWDGSHIALATVVKNNMKNPESYEHVETRYNVLNNSIEVGMKYRGTNAFNAVVTEYVYAEFDIDGKFIRIIE